MNPKGNLPIKLRKQFHSFLFWNIGITQRWNNEVEKGWNIGLNSFYSIFQSPNVPLFSLG
jgi:hypothetical protein